MFKPYEFSHPRSHHRRSDLATVSAVTDDRQTAARSGRRELLADAAIAILARSGGRGLTHRAVDREAHVPEGTTKNYFPTRESLLEAAAYRLTDQHRAAVEQLHSSTPAEVTATQISALYPALLQRTINDPTQLLALVELYLEAVRRPGIKAALGQMAITNAESAAELQRSAGLPTEARNTGAIDAYLLGIALSLLALPEGTLDRIGLNDPQELGRAIFAATAAK